MEGMVSDYLLASFELWGAVACLFIAFYTQRVKIIFPAGANYMSLMLVISATMMFSDVVSFTSNGRTSDYAFYANRISNFLCFTLAYVCLHLFSSYIVSFIKPDIPTKVGEYFVKDFAVVGILAVIFNIFNPFYYYFDESNTYQRGPFFELGQILTMIPFLVIAFIIIHNRKQIGRNGFIAFISYVTFPAISILLTAGQYTRVSRLNIGISMALYFMVAIIISDQRRSIFEQRKAILDQEREINEMQIRLVISQIQPHFLYNSLNTIYYLCEKDVALAQEAINNFSNYLRGNMNALGATKPVDFAVELNHVKNYLALEEMRFGDELEVEYDIETTNFQIPSLCLQPLVENAVKHGVGKKIGGGCVTIRVKELSDSYEVIVEDDGVGYDMSVKKEDGRTHVGIDNVKNRIERMVHGSLFIKSEVGKGTIALIHIPK